MKERYWKMGAAHINLQSAAKILGAALVKPIQKWD